ncbi:MAG TPA: hypothetical protein VGL39_04525 [Jatrophihabitantaceae bacterium]|jgi:hypothetical protein
MAGVHELRFTSSPGGLLIECEAGCGRRLVVDRGGALTVVDRGDPHALHRGSTGDIELSPPTVAQP